MKLKEGLAKVKDDIKDGVSTKLKKDILEEVTKKDILMERMSLINTEKRLLSNFSLRPWTRS